MIYENSKGIYKKVNGIYQNVSGTNKPMNKKIEIVDGIGKKVYHPWVLVKNGKLVNKFHLVFFNTYANAFVDLKDYTNLYENEDGVWIELSKQYVYSSYLSGSKRFLIGISVPCNIDYRAEDFVLESTYRSVNYSTNYQTTLWGLFPFQAGAPAKREDYHIEGTSYSGTFNTRATLLPNSNSENFIYNGKYYLTLVGVQQSRYNTTHKVTYNSLKICIKNLYCKLNQEL